MNHQSRNQTQPNGRGNYGLGLTHDEESDIQGCKNLWSAVLRAAAHDAWFGGKKDGGLLKRQAVAWFGSSNEDVGGCVWICQILGMDINAVRQRVGA